MLSRHLVAATEKAYPIFLSVLHSIKVFNVYYVPNRQHEVDYMN